MSPSKIVGLRPEKAVLYEEEKNGKISHKRFIILSSWGNENLNNFDSSYYSSRYEKIKKKQLSTKTAWHVRK